MTNTLVDTSDPEIGNTNGTNTSTLDGKTINNPTVNNPITKSMKHLGQLLILKTYSLLMNQQQ